MQKRRGYFIAIDGIDGAGKTTLCAQLQMLLAPYDPVVTKEPTAESPWGQQLRDAAKNGRLPRDVELELFHKDRLYHIKHVIEPYLAAGNIVICDRYVDSTLAFQAHDASEADSMYDGFERDIIVPDVTFILKCPVEVGLQRIEKNRPEISAFERQDILEHAKSIYESRHGDNYVFIDASGTPENTLAQVVAESRRRFPELSSVIDAHYKRLFGQE